MGSVGPDYRCPGCGRRGNGGYIIDGIEPPVPLCTDGPVNCLWGKVQEHGWGAREIVAEALHAVFRPKGGLSNPLRQRIGAYLVG